LNILANITQLYSHTIWRNQGGLKKPRQLKWIIPVTSRWPPCMAA